MTLDDRRASIIRLLQHRDDHLPEPPPPRWTNEASTGFVHRTLAPQVCEVCEGVNSFGCTGCGGRGEVERPRTHDPYAKTVVMPYGFDGNRHEANRARDKQLQVLAEQLRPATKIDELADANEHPFSWEIARQQMYRDFDFGALDLALEQLREHDHDAYRALHAVYVYGWLVAPAGLAAAACERGLLALHPLLPEKLRAPAEPQPVVNLAARGRGADKRALAQRDAAIRQAITNQSTTEVAEAFGLTVSQVNKIASRAA